MSVPVLSTTVIPSNCHVPRLGASDPSGADVALGEASGGAVPMMACGIDGIAMTATTATKAPISPTIGSG